MAGDRRRLPGGRRTVPEGADEREVTAGMDESRRAWLAVGVVVAVILLNLLAIILMNTL